MGRPDIIGQHFEGRTWQADEKGMEITWMFFWVFKRNSTVVDSCLQMANEAVSKYHYPCLVVGNLVTIPKSREEETKNVLARVTLVDAGPPVGVGYGVVDEIVGRK
jgi:hypothetical protein